MRWYKIICSYFLGIILFVLLNAIGIFIIIKNTFKESTLRNIVNSINVYDIVMDKFINLNEFGLDSSANLNDVFNKVGIESNLDNKVVDSIVQNEKVTNSINDTVLNIVLNKYKKIDSKIEQEEINNSINTAFNEYENKTGINIEESLKEKFNNKINAYLTQIENKINNLDLGTMLLGNNVIVSESKINKIILILLIFTFIDVMLIIYINQNMKLLLNIGIPFLGTSIIFLSFGIIRKIILGKLVLSTNSIRIIIYHIIKDCFINILKYGVLLFIISVILIFIYYLKENKD